MRAGGGQLRRRKSERMPMADGHTHAHINTHTRTHARTLNTHAHINTRTHINTHTHFFLRWTRAWRGWPSDESVDWRQEKGR